MIGRSKRIDRSSFNESSDGFAWAADLSNELEFKASELHYLIISSREVSRLYDLTVNEQEALWKYVEYMVGKALKVKNINSIGILINDGRHAGQTIGHIHVHIVGFNNKEELNLNERFNSLTKKYCDKRNLPIKKINVKTIISNLYKEINSNLKYFLTSDYGLSVFSSNTIIGSNNNLTDFTIEVWSSDSPRTYGLTNLLRVISGYRKEPYNWPSKNKDSVFNKTKI